MQIDFANAFARCPLVAILRGIDPAQAVGVGSVLIDAGFSLIEVPLNSPDPLSSIEKLVEIAGDRALIGGGTVIDTDAVAALADRGARYMVSPNVDVAVITAADRAGLAAVPGFWTATEAFAALNAGATALKLFPADAAQPRYLRALRAVLPPDARLLAVGGIGPADLADWNAAGADGFGLGSALFTPDMTLEQVASHAHTFIAAWKTIEENKNAVARA